MLVYKSFTDVSLLTRNIFKVKYMMDKVRILK